ncbi:hypothetical protein T492DRAFT_833761 [Pavlovales sp. CCMP2436]|nr:hypothetical protein T492DRAFT_833761 [Pavlovales sp. CCMP2436]
MRSKSWNTGSHRDRSTRSISLAEARASTASSASSQPDSLDSPERPGAPGLPASSGRPGAPAPACPAPAARMPSRRARSAAVCAAEFMSSGQERGARGGEGSGQRGECESWVRGDARVGSDGREGGRPRSWQAGATHAAPGLRAIFRQAGSAARGTRRGEVQTARVD